MNPNQPRFIALAASSLVAILAGCKDYSEEGRVEERSRPVPTNRDADNTARNVRDRDDATLTPGDQGNSPRDREVTQKIRQALVVDTSGYSTVAKNIKIITVDGKVTLRGPVKTDAEKTGVVSIASGIAGADNVVDQLEVKTNP